MTSRSLPGADHMKIAQAQSRKRERVNRRKISRWMRELKKDIDRYSKLPRFSVEAWKERFLGNVLAPIGAFELALFEQRYKAVLEGVWR